VKKTKTKGCGVKNLLVENIGKFSVMLNKRYLNERIRIFKVTKCRAQDSLILQWA